MNAELGACAEVTVPGPAGGVACDAYTLPPRDTGVCGTAILYGVVPDIDVRYAHVTAAGAEIAGRVAAQRHGRKRFTARDPEGGFRTFGEDTRRAADR